MPGRIRGLIVAWALLAAAAVAAEKVTPANTLMDLRRQFGGCLSTTPLGPAGSRVTIAFMMKRDGSIFGKPRIAYSHLEGDTEAQKRFLVDAERAVELLLASERDARPRRRDRRAIVHNHAGQAEAGGTDLDALPRLSRICDRIKG